jgi:proline iminopeptidase
MDRDLQSNVPAAHEGYLRFPGAELYYRVLGKGQAIFVLHGGPEFDHNYLFPEMDRLADAFRFIH